MEIKPFKGKIRKLTEENNVFEPTQEFNDRYIFGMSVTDENGNRIDPRLIRAKTDGSLWVLDTDSV